MAVVQLAHQRDKRAAPVPNPPLLPGTPTLSMPLRNTSEAPTPTPTPTQYLVVVKLVHECDEAARLVVRPLAEHGHTLQVHGVEAAAQGLVVRRAQLNAGEV